MEFSLFFLFAIGLDLLFGDPRWYPHPVRLIGWLCTTCENYYRKLFAHNLRLAGLVSVISVMAVTLATLYLLLLVCHYINIYLEICCAVLLLYSSVAIRDLLVHSKDVYKALNDHDLELAREKVSMIVGRDTTALDEAAVARAAVETVAENMADGIIAPLFFAIVAAVIHGLIGQSQSELVLMPISWAALGAYFYKACNTMDSMFGYKNERYLDFGRYAAKLDDILNYVPARLAGIFLILAAPFMKMPAGDALRVFLRDRLAHSSPNAAHPEAAMAGALGVVLGGPSTYFDTVVIKPTIGQELRPIEAKDILRANRLVCIATLLFVVTILCVYLSLSVFFVY